MKRSIPCMKQRPGGLIMISVLFRRALVKRLYFVSVVRKSHGVVQNSEYQSSRVEEAWSGKWSWSQPHSSKFYMLSMFPYPSGHLHMGHVRVYTISDTLARFQRMRGRQVLHPMGWDAFGLPAENAAIDSGVDPLSWTAQNIQVMRSQLDRMGCHFDWDREVTTCSPDYYHWTQWLFLQLYKQGLAYKKKALVNWDPVDQTVLANEQVDESGRSWRSGALVEQRYLNQWFFKITQYADALLKGLESLDWPQNVKNIQSQWIGRSSGAYFNFPLSVGGSVRVFTTQPHTVYGVTFLAISHQHPLSEAMCGESGVMSSVYATHPLTGATLPVCVADYVLDCYGTEAVMGVPAHDERDLDFASEHALPVTMVIAEGRLVNSKQFSGLSVEEGGSAIVEHARLLGMGDHMTTYKLRDWLISRQRYWGAPIPILHCEECGVVPVPEEQLPVLLPDNHAFTGRGPSPLATDTVWRRGTCGKPDCCAQRESDTMDTFVDSSWYFLRFASSRQARVPFTDDVNHWMPVDIYVGGIEHAHLHLLYARFICHVLHDIGLLATKEPFQKLIAQGMVQGRTYKEKGSGRYLRHDEERSGPNVEVSWEKMSKSKFNGVDPAEILEQYGADSARLFMLFKAPPEQGIQWDDQAIQGVHRWLHRLWRLTHSHIHTVREGVVIRDLHSERIVSATHKAIKQVTEAMDGRHTLNTALPELMILTNVLRDHTSSSNTLAYHEALCTLVTLLAPMAPHISAALWEGLVSARGYFRDSPHLKGGVCEQEWPQWRKELLNLSKTRKVVVQVNGRKRGVVEVPVELTSADQRSQLISTIFNYTLEKELLKSCDHSRDLRDRMIVASNGLLVNIVI